jgi:3-oxoacyl-[acyl-carrier protein] reductase
MSITIDQTGRTALVTGGTRGNGLAVAPRLVEAGARVAVMSRNAEQARAVAAELGAGMVGVGCDVTDLQQVEAVVPEVTDQLGGIDILVNNAGFTRDNILLRLAKEDWDDVLATNLTGAFHMTKAVIKGMMKRRAGQLRGVESRVDRVHQVGGPGVWQPEYFGQLRRPRAHQHRPDEQLAPGGPKGVIRCSSAGPRGTACRCGRGSRVPGL